MENKDKPAFPTSEVKLSGDIIIDGGLTKREYFAGLAMQGLHSWLINPSEKQLSEYAKICVSMANKLLKQLEESCLLNTPNH